MASSRLQDVRILEGFNTWANESEARQSTMNGTEDTGRENVEIIRSLNKWSDAWVDRNFAYFRYSEAWDQYQEEIWAEYDQLDARRVRASLPKVPWQPTVEAVRDAVRKDRPKLYSPLEGKLMDQCPLGTCVEPRTRFDDTLREYPWRVALSGWDKIQKTYSEDHDFRQHLSPSQLCSYEILTDWWHASYCDGDTIRRAHSYMREQLNARYPWFPHAGRPAEETTKAMKTQSIYHARCYNLFLMEFHPGTWEPFMAGRNAIDIENARRDTAACAIAHRFAASALYWPRGGNPPGTNGRLPKYPRLPTTPGQKTGVSPMGSPYYLWDTQKRVTTVVNELPRCPDYVCISHTWGRWVDGSKPPFELPGVPWPIPSVRPERFAVEELPQQLGQLGYRYIWFDLFCIPQVPIEPWRTRFNSQELDIWREKADDEIARQSTIFRGSKRCIAWLTDISTWKDMKRALKWMSMRFLKDSRASFDGPLQATSAKLFRYTSHARAKLFKNSLAQTLIALKVDEDAGLVFQVALSWFTSLWTLQEAVLCPEMELCCKNWSRLEDDWGSAISLKSLLVFIHQCSDVGKAKWKWPAGPAELNDLHIHTSMANVLMSESPMAVCAATALRQCSGPPSSRAPAIMSAIGVTDWWHVRDIPVTNPFGTEELPSQLVLDLYPLGFLQEAARKIGAVFYSLARWEFEINGETPQVLVQNTRVGSMLPFRKPGYVGLVGDWSLLKIPDISVVDAVDRPCVASWHICADGSVKIRSSAEIVASSAESDQHEIPAVVACTIDPELRERLGSEVPGTKGQGTTPDLAKFLRVLAGKDRMYAVNLYSDGPYQAGIVLLGMDTNASTTRYFVKVGTFEAFVEPPDETCVDWVIL